MGRGIFDIDIFKLADGDHRYDFEFESSFFGFFEDSLIDKGQGKVTVDLTKTASMISLSIGIDGEVELICDRSLDTFMYPIKEVNEVRLKYGDHWEELSEDLILIPANTQKVDVGQFVYEFVTLAVPMKKLHPRFENEEDFFEEGTPLANESSNGTTDPRWNELKKLKKNK